MTAREDPDRMQDRGARAKALGGPLAARLTTVIVLVLPSLVFGLAYERSGNIAVPAVIHGTYNAALLALSYHGAQAAAGG